MTNNNNNRNQKRRSAETYKLRIIVVFGEAARLPHILAHYRRAVFSACSVQLDFIVMHVFCGILCLKHEPKLAWSERARERAKKQRFAMSVCSFGFVLARIDMENAFAYIRIFVFRLRVCVRIVNLISGWLGALRRNLWTDGNHFCVFSIVCYLLFAARAIL